MGEGKSRGGAIVCDPKCPVAGAYLTRPGNKHRNSSGQHSSSLLQPEIAWPDLQQWRWELLLGISQSFLSTNEKENGAAQPLLFLALLLEQDPADGGNACVREFRQELWVVPQVQNGPRKTLDRGRIIAITKILRDCDSSYRWGINRSRN